MYAVVSSSSHERKGNQKIAIQACENNPTPVIICPKVRVKGVVREAFPRPTWSFSPP